MDFPVPEEVYCGILADIAEAVCHKDIESRSVPKFCKVKRDVGIINPSL